MPPPSETFKLPRGMGRLIRYTTAGAWSWQRWDPRLEKWASTATNEVNRSRAEQFVFQQMALEDAETFRYRGVSVLFTSVADEYLRIRENGSGLKKLRPASILKFQTALAAFESFIGTGYDALTAEHVDSVMLRGFAEREFGRIGIDSANRNVGFITRILDFAQKRGYILRLPQCEPVVDQTVASSGGTDDDDGIEGWPCPTAEEVRLILAHSKPNLSQTGQTADNGCDKGRPVYRGINANDYSDLFAAICLTGMRIGEAVHLTWDDIDRKNKVVLIRPGRKNGKFWQPKTKFGTRRIAIVPKLEAILQNCRKANRTNHWVFETRRGTQLHPHNVAKRFRQICTAVGLKRHYVVHSLRKYWASTVASQGMDAKVLIKMFGHSDFDLILRTYYAQNDDARMVAEATKIDFGLDQPRTQTG